MNFDFLKNRKPLVWPVFGLCAFLPLSIAGIGIFKLLTVLTSLAVLVVALLKGRQLVELRTGPTVLALCMLGALSASLTYTSVSITEALSVLTKYGKLLLIPAIALLIRSRAQAVTAIWVYFFTQSFVLLTSWLLFAGLKLPWVPTDRCAAAVVYSCYLDQAILTAGFAAIAWHLRANFPTRYGQHFAITMAALAALNLLFALPGRTGQVCLFATIALGIWWSMPRKLRPLAVLAPFVAFALAMLLSTQFNQRYTTVFSEVKVYQSQNGGHLETSSGQRLNYWWKSLQAITEKPLLGYGVGSWQQQYWRLESSARSSSTASVRNPHQEFLFWGVQLGVVGVLLLAAWLGSFWWASRHFAPPVMQATVSLLVVFTVACALNSALYDGLVGDYFCALLAVLLALGRHSAIPSSRP
jgi:O-antigen ligase